MAQPLPSRRYALSGGEERLVVFTTSAGSLGEHGLSLGTLPAAFTVIAGTVPMAPVSFTTTNLYLETTSIAPGDTVNISVLMTNNGDAEGTTEVELFIDGAVEATEQIQLPGGDSATVIFPVSRDAIGAYTVSVGEMAELLVIITAEPLLERDTSAGMGAEDDGSGLYGGVVSAIIGVAGATAVVALYLLRRRHRV